MREEGSLLIEKMIHNKQKRLKDIVVCPHCYSELIWCKSYIECPKCRIKFIFKDGIPDFKEHNNIEQTRDSEFQAELMFNNTFTARLYNIGKKILSSEYMPKDHLREFIDSIGEDKIIVELGSGSRSLRGDIINIDLFSFPNVDLISDIKKLPLKNNVVDFVIIDKVLEHVPEPNQVVKEMYRILKSGGKAICIVPFIFPYHGYPKNYMNFSKDGIEFMFRDFSECKVQMCTGPISGLIYYLTEIFSIALSGENKFFYTFFKGLGLLPVFYFKYLDRFWNSSGRAVRISSTLCALLTK